MEYRFESGEDEIVDQVNHKMALKRGEIEEIESDDEEEDEQEEDIGIGELRSLCEKVECLSLKYGDYLPRPLSKSEAVSNPVEEGGDSKGEADDTEQVVQQERVTLESHNMSLLMSLSRFVTPVYTGINLIMHRKLALSSIMHYENFYCSNKIRKK